MKRFILTVLLLNICGSILAAIGCIDNSYHVMYNCACKYDYKAYRYVCCSCDCERYGRLSDRGECLQCGHYRLY